MREVALKELCEMKSGGTPSRRKPSYYEGTIPWAKISDLESSSDGYMHDTEEHITEEALESINNRYFHSGTLFLAMYGSVGKTAISKISLSTNQAILGINIKESNLLDICYLQFWLKTIKQKLLNRAVGGTLQNISLGIVKELKIPLPPLPQQKKIAAILDAADTYRQKTKALIAKYDELSQSLFLDMFGDPVKNEKGWEKKTVEQVCAKIYGGGTPSKAHPEYYNGGIPWVTPKDMKSEYIRDSIDHVNQLGVDNSSAKLIPKNSVLMVIRSGILKHTLPVAINIKVVAINQDMKAYIPNKELTNSLYLKSFFQAISGLLLSKVRAVTADNIEFRQIKELSFICPPLEYQNQFASRIQAIESQKAQAQKSLEKAEELFNSLLQRAFKGELNA